MPDDNQFARFPDDVVRRILERAIELDSALDDSISEADLQRIANELRIRPVALQRAIAETKALAAATKPIRPALMITPKPLVPLLVGAIGVLAGVLTRGSWLPAVSSGGLHAGTLTTAFALQCSAVLLAVWYRGTARYERFLLTNVAIWGGFTFGWIYLHSGHLPSYFFGVVAPPVVLCGIAGAAIIWLRDRLHRIATTRLDAGSPGAGTSSASASFIERVRESLLGLLRPWTRMMQAVNTRLVAPDTGGKSNFV